MIKDFLTPTGQEIDMKQIFRRPEAGNCTSMYMSMSSRQQLARRRRDKAVNRLIDVNSIGGTVG